LDSSALLALLNHEAGAEQITPELLSLGTCSTVNLAEVQGKLVCYGVDPEEAWQTLLSLIAAPVAFTADHARIAGGLIRRTHSLGLSLGDRACLALGIALKADVYTADRAWGSLRIGIRVHVIR
jgi:PIN domain nuclease of toxin-antitoxin system